MGNDYNNINIYGEARVQLGDTHVQQIQNDDEKLFAWLSPLNPWISHDEARQKRSEGTVEWILSTEAFMIWFKEDTKVLWCPGPMGVERQSCSPRSWTFSERHKKARAGWGWHIYIVDTRIGKPRV